MPGAMLCFIILSQLNFLLAGELKQVMNDFDVAVVVITEYLNNILLFSVCVSGEP